MAERVAVALVAAVAENGVIGAAGAMPWRLATDMKRFRALTMGKPVIMGRKTFASIGKPRKPIDPSLAITVLLAQAGVVALVVFA